MGRKLIIIGADFTVNAIDRESYYVDLDYAKVENNNTVFAALASGSNLYLDYDIQLLSQPSAGDIYGMGHYLRPLKVQGGYFMIGDFNLMAADLNRHTFRYAKTGNTTVVFSSGANTVTKVSTYSNNFDFVGVSGISFAYSFQCKIFAVNQYSDSTFATKIHSWVPKKYMPQGIIGLYDTIDNRFVVPTTGELTEDEEE